MITWTGAVASVATEVVTARYCRACEVGWTSDDVCCWSCGRTGETGYVVARCLRLPPSGNWGPGLFGRGTA